MPNCPVGRPTCDTGQPTASGQSGTLDAAPATRARCAPGAERSPASRQPADSQPTTTDRYVSREQAAELALAADQISEPKHQLYSEDLY